MQTKNNMVSRSSEFWGICCEGGKKYTQVVRQRFHLTMAALEPSVVPTSPVVSLMVDRGDCEYLLCSLKPGSLLQVNLNLYFDKGEKVTFSLKGQGIIHLSGYHIYNQDETVPSAINEKSKTISGKKKVDKKVKKTDDESEEESDDDAFDDLDDSSEDEESEEETEKDSKRLQNYKRLWSTLAAESDEEEEESDSDEDDAPVKKDFQNQKRMKKENSEIISPKKTEKNTPAKSLKLDSNKKSKSEKKTNNQDLNSSIGRTPMPQKKTPKENKTVESVGLTPKKVDFEVADESSDSDNEKKTNAVKATPIKGGQPATPIKGEQPATPNSESKKKKKKKKKNQATPDTAPEKNDSKSPKGLSSASYNQKLAGGLEFEDIRVGMGPIAKKGRLVHVYYTGMLENNKVFDSREIGNKPFSFKLGANQVIKGWDMAIEGMKVGGKRRMKIPASLGYKNERTGPIPPNSTLYFTVELKAVS